MRQATSPTIDMHCNTLYLKSGHASFLMFAMCVVALRESPIDVSISLMGLDGWRSRERSAMRAYSSKPPRCGTSHPKKRTASRASPRHTSPCWHCHAFQRGELRRDLLLCCPRRCTSLGLRLGAAVAGHDVRLVAVAVIVSQLPLHGVAGGRRSGPFAASGSAARYRCAGCPLSRRAPRARAACNMAYARGGALGARSLVGGSSPQTLRRRHAPAHLRRHPDLRW